jgi:hypothetical protein
MMIVNDKNTKWHKKQLPQMLKALCVWILLINNEYRDVKEAAFWPSVNGRLNIVNVH